MFQTNLKVQELRQRGQNRAADRLEKKMFMDSRPAQLKKEFGMNDADAAAAAQREWDIQHPDRAGTIRGAWSVPGVSGMDWLKNFDKLPSALMPRNNDAPSALDWVKGKKTAKAADAAVAPGFQASAGQDVGQLLRNIYEVLKEKLPAAGPVADQLKPKKAA